MESGRYNIHYQHREGVGKSYLTSIRPDYYLARTNSLFDYHQRYAVKQYRASDLSTVLNQRNNKPVMIQQPSESIFPTLYRKLPTFVDRQASYSMPRSGNQPMLQGTMGPYGEANYYLPKVNNTIHPEGDRDKLRKQYFTRVPEQYDQIIHQELDKVNQQRDTKTRNPPMYKIQPISLSSMGGAHL